MWVCLQSLHTDVSYSAYWIIVIGFKMRANREEILNRIKFFTRKYSHFPSMTFCGKRISLSLSIIYLSIIYLHVILSHKTVIQAQLINVVSALSFHIISLLYRSRFFYVIVVFQNSDSFISNLFCGNCNFTYFTGSRLVWPVNRGYSLLLDTWPTSVCPVLRLYFY